MSCQGKWSGGEHGAQGLLGCGPLAEEIPAQGHSLGSVFVNILPSGEGAAFQVSF